MSKRNPARAGLALVLLCGALSFLAAVARATDYYVAPNGTLDPFANEGTLAILYCFIFFYLVFAGGGAWSLDALLRRR